MKKLNRVLILSLASLWLWGVSATLLAQTTPPCPKYSTLKTFTVTTTNSSNIHLRLVITLGDNHFGMGKTCRKSGDPGYRCDMPTTKPVTKSYTLKYCGNSPIVINDMHLVAFAQGSQIEMGNCNYAKPTKETTGLTVVYGPDPKSKSKSKSCTVTLTNN